MITCMHVTLAGPVGPARYLLLTQRPNKRLSQTLPLRCAAAVTPGSSSSSTWGLSVFPRLDKGKLRELYLSQRPLL